MTKTTRFRLAYAQSNAPEFARHHSSLFAQDPAAGFLFANKRSRENYDAAMCGLPLNKIRRPLTIITGPRASGKSRLARQICAVLGDAEPMRVITRTAALFKKDLDTACSYELPTLIAEDVSFPIKPMVGQAESLPWIIATVPPGYLRTACVGLLASARIIQLDA